MLRALIFDFDGVIADAEPVHMRAFQEVLSEEGLSLSRQEYYDKYLALDDKTFFRTALKDKGRGFDQRVIENLMSRKSNYYDRFIKEEIVILPGVPDFVRNAAERYTLAIGSGALRHEIEFILDYAGIKGMFRVITSTEDVENCKPAPDVFLKALERINSMLSPSSQIDPDECLVIEDSIAGIKAARAAGMKCLAVTNSYPAERLSQADMVVNSLEDVKMEDLKKLF